MQNPQSLKPYKTVRSAGESAIVVEKSRFLGYCIPVSSETEALERLGEIRKRHWDAKHTCYAFRIVWNGGVSRSSDDGEPSGTAGAPILNVLATRGVENVLCAIVRYFGGVLLGTGGLVRAYGRAASEALNAAGVIDMRVCEALTIEVSYAAYAALEPVFRSSGRRYTAEYGEAVTLKCDVPEEEADRFARDVTDRTDGCARIRREGRRLCAFDG